MKAKNKKIIVTLGTTVIFLAPVFLVISCGNKKEEERSTLRQLLKNDGTPLVKYKLEKDDDGSEIHLELRYETKNKLSINLSRADSEKIANDIYKLLEKERNNKRVSEDNLKNIPHHILFAIEQSSNSNRAVVFSTEDVQWNDLETKDKIVTLLLKQTGKLNDNAIPNGAHYDTDGKGNRRLHRPDGTHSVWEKIPTKKESEVANIIQIENRKLVNNFASLVAINKSNVLASNAGTITNIASFNSATGLVFPTLKGNATASIKATPNDDQGTITIAIVISTPKASMVEDKAITKVIVGFKNYLATT